MHKNYRFTRDVLKAVAWKNGNGLTREIACSMPNEAYWRFSIADVTIDGEFSLFPKLERILTVVGGNGMMLSKPHKDIEAQYANPIHFAGGIPIYGKLCSGAVQNFNLIYDAAKIEVMVQVGGLEIYQPQDDKNTIMSLLYCLATHQGIINPTEEIDDRNNQWSHILFFQLKFKR